MITRKFPYPKDPLDVAPYLFQSFEQVTSVNGTPASQPQGANKTPGFATPSDALTGGPLTFPNVGITTQDVTVPDLGLIKAGFGIVVWIGGGVPGHNYVVTIQYTTLSGANLTRSAILEVSGQ